MIPVIFRFLRWCALKLPFIRLIQRYPSRLYFLKATQMLSGLRYSLRPIYSKVRRLPLSSLSSLRWWIFRKSFSVNNLRNRYLGASGPSTFLMRAGLGRRANIGNSLAASSTSSKESKLPIDFIYFYNTTWVGPAQVTPAVRLAWSSSLRSSSFTPNPPRPQTQNPNVKCDYLNRS